MTIFVLPGPRGAGGGAGAGAAAIPRGPGGRQEGDAGGQHQDQAQSRHQTRVREDGPVRPQAWTKRTQMKHFICGYYNTKKLTLTVFIEILVSNRSIIYVCASHQFNNQ